MKVYGGVIGWDAVAEATRTEQLGFDGVRVVDHYYCPWPPDPPQWWPHPIASLAAAAVSTAHVALTETVFCAAFRHPAEVAQAIATIDRISGGRAELGLGAGWYQPEHDSFGIEFRSARDRVHQVVEAALVCRTMFEGSGAISHHGKFFHAESEFTWPTHSHRPEVMVGASRSGLVRAAAAVADRIDLLHVLESGLPALGGRYSNSRSRLESLCNAGRRAAEMASNQVQFSATVYVSLADSPAVRRERRQLLANVAHADEDDLQGELLYVVGQPGDLLRAVETLSSFGISRIHIAIVPPDSEETLDRVLSLLPELKSI